MRDTRRLLVALLTLTLLLAVPSGAQADCPGNLLRNPSFEEGMYQGEQVGTSLSSWLSVHWLPWAVLGDQQINREIEFFVVDSQVLQEGTYRVHHGRYAQKFFSGFSTHNAGFYQRVAVTPGAQVTFSIWVQIATGQEEQWSMGLPISDLNAPGNYRVWAGIDPYGDTPPGFGAPPSARTVWSNPVIDRETRMYTAEGHPYDGWVRLTVTTIAQANHVTVFTRGQPEFPVKNNSSFWDSACLVVSTPPTPTPLPTSTPTMTPEATATPLPTETPVATVTPEATATPPPTETPVPTEIPPPTETPTMTATAAPTEAAEATATVPPTPTPEPVATEAPTPTDVIAPPAEEAPPASNGSPAPYLIASGAALVALATGWLVYSRRRGNGGG